LIGASRATDKCSAAHNYLAFYEHFLAKFRDEKFTLLEIGVYKGSGAETWLEYFRFATIVGVDINPSRAKSVEHERYIGLQADASNIALMTSIISSYEPTILVDDGSHLWQHQLISLAHYAPLVKKSGVFILEDLEVCHGEVYERDYGKGFPLRPTNMISDLANSILTSSLSSSSTNQHIMKSIAPSLFSSICAYKHTVLCTMADFYS